MFQLSYHLLQPRGRVCEGYDRAGEPNPEYTVPFHVIPHGHPKAPCVCVGLGLGVKIEPPLSSDMVFSLLEAQEIEVEEGKLTGFQCLAEEFVAMKVHKFYQLKNRKWVG